MLTITKESHTDHGLTPAHLDFLKERFANKDAFFIETIELPENLSDLKSGLYGPIAGDAPVDDLIVNMVVRGDRPNPSRLVKRHVRPTRKVTVIAGPHEEHACMLYTAFGGEQTPREPGDPSLDSEVDRVASEAFWSVHALSSMQMFTVSFYYTLDMHPQAGQVSHTKDVWAFSLAEAKEMAQAFPGGARDVKAAA